jgi:hypothetical protein
MFSKSHFDNLIKRAACSPVWGLACLIVCAFLALLHGTTQFYRHHASHDHSAASNSLTSTSHVTLVPMPSRAKSHSNSLIQQVAGTSDSKYLSFDDFMTVYGDDPASNNGPSANNSSANNPSAGAIFGAPVTQAPAAQNPFGQEPAGKAKVDLSAPAQTNSLYPSFDATSNKPKTSTPAFSNSSYNNSPQFGSTNFGAPTSTSVEQKAVANQPASDASFTDWMNKSQPVVKPTPEEKARLLISQVSEQVDDKTTSMEAPSPWAVPQAVPQTTAPRTTLSNSPTPTQNKLPSLSNTGNSTGNSDEPRLLIAETAKSLQLPTQVVQELVRAEAGSPGGLKPTQVRNLIGMMVAEAARLNEKGQKLEAARLCRFVKFVADEAQLATNNTDGELMATLYLADQFMKAASSTPEKPTPDKSTQEFKTNSPANSPFPAVVPESFSNKANATDDQKLVRPTTRTNVVYANQPMTIASSGFEMQKIQHQQAMTASNSPFQSATYSKPISTFERPSASQEFNPGWNDSTATSGGLSFPTADAPPPIDPNNLASGHAQDGQTDFALNFPNGNSTAEKSAYKVEDQLIVIPEQVTYGLMFGMLAMIVLLMFRRK